MLSISEGKDARGVALGDREFHTPTRVWTARVALGDREVHTPTRVWTARVALGDREFHTPTLLIINSVGVLLVLGSAKEFWA